MRHQIASDWDELRQAVRAVMRGSGFTAAAVGAACGYAPSTVTMWLGSRAVPSAPFLAALQAWLDRDGRPAPVDGTARADAALQHACATPAVVPPSWDPSPHPLMCAPIPKIPVAAEIVSSPVTAWEYVVVRLPDHDWPAQDARLSGYGAQGWELVSVSGGVAYLKRERVRGG